VQPRKNPRSKQKLKRINASARDQWKRILKDVEKKEIPISLLQSINVNLIDGTVVNVDIKELLSSGHDPETIEELLDLKLKSLDHIISDVDFFVSIDEVVKTVQPITDHILKDL
jgi:hypothetical protein